MINLINNVHLWSGLRSDGNEKCKKTTWPDIGCGIGILAFQYPGAGGGQRRHHCRPIQYTLSVDGKSVSLWAYEIDGGMYFKLRDLAMALSGTEKQFDISWTFDSDCMGIDLLSGSIYVNRRRILRTVQSRCCCRPLYSVFLL